MDGYTENGSRRWMAILTGTLVGVALAALAMALFLFFRMPSLVREEVGEALVEWQIPFAVQQQLETPAAASSSSQPGIQIEDPFPVNRLSALVLAVEKVTPAVVSVITTRVETYSPRPRTLSEFFGLSRPPVQAMRIPSIGSGIVVTPTGRVVTNNHVITGANRIFVTLSDGREFGARLLDTSIKYDIALLQLELPEGVVLDIAELGESEDVRIGEWAIAMGSPFGLELNAVEPSVTVGVISALHREIHSTSGALYTDMIQTDADINPGNSGGPLVNSEGKVIGINTLIFTKDGGSLGIGFARPINLVRWILEEFENYGHVRDAWAGFEVQNLSRFHVVHYDLKTSRGIFVTRVYANGPAAAAGLQTGDVIVAIAGQEINRIEEGNRILFRYEVGDDVPFLVNRDGELIEFHVELEAYTKQAGEE